MTLSMISLRMRKGIIILQEIRYVSKYTKGFLKAFAFLYVFNIIALWSSGIHFGTESMGVWLAFSTVVISVFSLGWTSITNGY